MGTSAKDHDREISHDVCHVPGFQALQWLLARHTNVTDVYYLLMALLLGQQARTIKSDGQVGVVGTNALVVRCKRTLCAKRDSKLHLWYSSKDTSLIFCAKSVKRKICPDFCITNLRF